MKADMIATARRDAEETGERRPVPSRQISGGLAAGTPNCSMSNRTTASTDTRPVGKWVRSSKPR